MVYIFAYYFFHIKILSLLSFPTNRSDPVCTYYYYFIHPRLLSISSPLCRVCTYYIASVDITHLIFIHVAGDELWLANSFHFWRRGVKPKGICRGDHVCSKQSLLIHEKQDYNHVVCLHTLYGKDNCDDDDCPNRIIQTDHWGALGWPSRTIGYPPIEFISFYHHHQSLCPAY